MIIINKYGFNLLGKGSACRSGKKKNSACLPIMFGNNINRLINQINNM